MVGRMLSSTVTVAVQEAAFPEPSVAVKVTVLAPTSAQVKAVMSSARVKVQLSVVPLSISAVVMLAFPVASNWMVIS